MILVSTFYVAFVVPYNAAFVQTDRLTTASDVVVEALFIVGECKCKSNQSHIEFFTHLSCKIAEIQYMICNLNVSSADAHQFPSLRSIPMSSENTFIPATSSESIYLYSLSSFLLCLLSSSTLLQTDILLNFRTTYVSSKGEVISDWKMIALNYLRGWFVVDFLAAIPFDHLYASNLLSGEVN